MKEMFIIQKLNTMMIRLKEFRNLLLNGNNSEFEKIQLLINILMQLKKEKQLVNSIKLSLCLIFL